MNIQSFFATHPVFTLADFERFLIGKGTKTANNRKRLLAYHSRKGHVVSIRTGLYAAIPVGAQAETHPVDANLIASRLTDDAVIGYHSALALHGVAHSLSSELNVITASPLDKPFRFQGMTYRTVLPPKALTQSHDRICGVVEVERQRLRVRVTSLERTLVDLLDRPRLGGGWEEIWRSYEAVPYLDLEQVLNYALLLSNATTIAKVGFFLEGEQERWMVGENHLALLRAHRPVQPHYIDRQRRETGRFVKEWNLVVPEHLVDRTWEETNEFIA